MQYDIANFRVSGPPVTYPAARTSGTSEIDKADPTPVPAAGVGLPYVAKKLAADGAKLEDVVKQLNDHAQAIQREVQFSIDKASGLTVVKVIDSKTKDIIRQIPSEEILALDHRLAQGDGLVFSAKA